MSRMEMVDLEYKILSYIDSRYSIEEIIKELSLDEEYMADIIIKLENYGLISLENKNWILIQKGKDILDGLKGSLKKLKIEHLFGNIDREEFQLKTKELESILVIEKINIEMDITKDKEKDKDMIICPICEKGNKIGSKFCSKCGAGIAGH